MVKSKKKEASHTHKKAKDPSTKKKKKSRSRSTSLSPSALLGFPKNHRTIDSVSFSTALNDGEGNLVERYKTFVQQQMKIISSVEKKHCGMMTLAKNENDAEDIGRYYITKLSSTDGCAISVLTDKKDLYVVALASKQYVWYLYNTVSEEFLMKVFPVNLETNFPRFVPLHFEGDYRSLQTETLARDTIPIGFEKLDQWITKLSEMFPKVDKDDNISYTQVCSCAMKKGFLLLIQMLSETLRVKPLYQTTLWFANMVDGQFNEFNVDKFVVRCENNWGQMSDCAWERARLTDQLHKTFELSDSQLVVNVVLEDGNYAQVQYQNIVSTVQHVDETLGILKSNNAKKMVESKERKKKH